METTFVVDHNTQSPVAQQLVVWAKHDRRIRTTHTGDGKLAFVVPNDLMGTTPGKYDPAAFTTGGTGGPTLNPAVSQEFTPTLVQVAGIDPNDYTTKKTNPVLESVAPARDKDGAVIPHSFLVTWTYDQRHTWFLITLAPNPAIPDADPQNYFVNVPGYRRSTVVTIPSTWTGVTATLRAVVTEGHYVPILSGPGAPTPPPTPPTGLTATCDASDTNGLTVLFSGDNGTNGPLTVTGSFTGGTATNAGDGTTTTQLVFPSGTTGAQTLTVEYAPGLTTTVNTVTLPCGGGLVAASTSSASSKKSAR